MFGGVIVEDDEESMIDLPVEEKEDSEGPLKTDTRHICPRHTSSQISAMSDFDYDDQKHTQTETKQIKAIACLITHDHFHCIVRNGRTDGSIDGSLKLFEAVCKAHLS